MATCTNCGSEMIADPSNSDRMVCPSCGNIQENRSNDNQGTPEAATQTQGVPQAAAATSEAATSANANPDSVPNESSFQQPPYYADPNMGAAQPNANLPKGFAVAALVLGILALLDCYIPIVNIIAIIMAILALIFGILGISRVNKGTASGKGLAIGGVVTGAIALVCALVINIAFGVLFNAAMQDEDVQSAIQEILDEGGYDESYTLRKGEGDLNQHSSLPTSPADDSAAWTTMEFTLGPNSFKIMETTLGDLVSTSGWTIDLKSDGFAESSMIDPHDELEDDLVLIQLKDPSDSYNSLWVLLANPTDAPLNIMQCPISSIDAEAYISTFDFTTCGVGLGSSIDEVITALGNPQDTYGSDDDDLTLSYETSDYSKTLVFRAMDGTVVDEVELSVNSF